MCISAYCTNFKDFKYLFYSDDTRIFETWVNISHGSFEVWIAQIKWTWNVTGKFLLMGHGSIPKIMNTRQILQPSLCWDTTYIAQPPDQNLARSISTYSRLLANVCPQKKAGCMISQIIKNQLLMYVPIRSLCRWCPKFI